MVHCRIGLWFTAAGSLALALGLGLRNWAHGSHAHFAVGFFLGLSVVLLIGGFVRQSRERLQR
jgi:hypothetical protein